MLAEALSVCPRCATRAALRQLAVQVDISKDVEESAKEGISAEFTYSVQWHETDITFDKRMDKYRKYQFLPEHLDVRLPWESRLLLEAPHPHAIHIQGCRGTCRGKHMPLHLWKRAVCSRQSFILGGCLVSVQPECCPAAQIHWFSIINSCVTVLLLTGFLATILMRVLKNDFVKYTRDDDGAALRARLSWTWSRSC